MGMKRTNNGSDAAILASLMGGAMFGAALVGLTLMATANAAVSTAKIAVDEALRPFRPAEEKKEETPEGGKPNDETHK